MLFADAIANPAATEATTMMSVLMAIFFGYIAIVSFIMRIFWKIFSKAGFSGARAFLMLIPGVNLVVILMFAFGEWPMRRELEMLRMQVMMQSQVPQIQQISLSAGGPQIMMPQQPQPYAPPPAAYPQPYAPPQPQPPYQPPYPQG